MKQGKTEMSATAQCSEVVSESAVGCNHDVIATTSNVLTSIDGLRVLYDPEVERGRTGRFHSLRESSLCGSLANHLFEQFPNGLYTHQHDAIESVLAGQNTVLSTRTSSGKSLIYSLPALHHLCEDPSATSLFLFPQKALANDQLIKLRSMARTIPSVQKHHSSKQYLVGRYDGSVEQDARSLIREQVQILLTNPDMLHMGILQHHENLWSRFFRNLKLVAIDECHEYRGIFGTNVALILRRLRQICRIHGSNPTLIATSATVSDPEGHMEKLTGQPFRGIDSAHDGSQQGDRKLWMVQTGDHFYDAGRKLALELAEKGLTVLAFCPSRVAAERMLARIPKRDEEMSHVRVYRSGLNGRERESIERGLRDRTVRVVFSTSALELGIDIGAIDVVVCIGLPHSMMSLWQRVGRAARGGREGAAVFIPADTPIDTYFANHPEELFSRDHEPLVLNLTNQRLLCQHYACAVQEADGRSESLDLPSLGDELGKIHQLQMNNALHRDELYRSDPHGEISIRGAGEGSYKLMEGDEPVGDIDAFHLLRESCRNAIYRHGGKSFRVKDVIRGRRLVQLRSERTVNETTPFIQKKIQLKQILKQADYPLAKLATVRLVVTEFLNSLTERDRSGKTVRSWSGSQGMPPHTLPTEGTMIVLKQPFWDRVRWNLRGNEMQALESCERLLGGLFPTISGPCDTQDFSSAVDQLQTRELAIFLYDAVYDGVGLTFEAFEHMKSLVQKAAERLQHCECCEDEGCFRCVANPNRERPASKSDAELILRELLAELSDQVPHLQTITADWTSTIEQTGSVPCPTCQSLVKHTDRFCANCGHKLQI
jgi:DEAD/DEAH box helicase domain-containing protein